MSQKESNLKQAKVSPERNGDKLQNAYFLSLELENVRCFSKRQKIDFSDVNGKPAQWTIILGDNGTGKTTLLQSLVAISPVTINEERFVVSSQVSKSKPEKNKERYSTPLIAIDETFQSLWNPLRSLISKLEYRDNEIIAGGSTGYRIDADFSIGYSFSNKRVNSKKATLLFISSTVGKTRKDSREEGFENFCCFAYGATRKSGETELSDVSKVSVFATLFDEHAFLINAEEWLLQTDYSASKESLIKDKAQAKLKKVKEILQKVLPDVLKEGENVTISIPTQRRPIPRVKFKTHYGWVEGKDLSIGYRTLIAWIVDFAARMFDRYPESENPLAEPAVVLIDEIDLHLHPKWQRELIDYLTNLFPNTQFIVTTHSPLIVQAAAARDANIVVCRREGDHVVIDQSVEAVRNWRTDQILTSDLFDLPIDRPIKIEPFLEERQKILSKAKLTKKDEKRLEELEEKIGSVPVMKNPKYDEAMDIILRAAEKLGKENGVSNDSHKKASKSSTDSKR